MADKFIDRLDQNSTISLGELDDYIRQEFTKPLVGQYARESEAVAAKRMMDVRQGLTDYLYSKVGPGAAPSQGLAQRAISVREAAENTFPVGTRSKPSGAGAEKIRNIRAATGDAQKNREVLQAYDEEYGTNLLHEAERLSMQREWNSDDLVNAYMVDSALQPTRPGFVKGVALPVARVGARATKMIGPVAAGVSGYRKRKRIPSVMESP